MKRHDQKSQRSGRAGTAALSPLLAYAACVGCAGSVGLAPGDVPSCPEVVLVEAELAPGDCLSDEALSALTTHCESLERIRGGHPDDE